MFEEPFTDMDTLVETLYRQMAPTLHESFAFLGCSTMQETHYKRDQLR